MSKFIPGRWPNNVARIRVARGLYQREVAEAAGVTKALIAMVECGAVQPRILTALRISKALKTTPDELWRPSILQWENL